jgi:two-component system, sensor histidine kinase
MSALDDVSCAECDTGTVQTGHADPQCDGLPAYVCIEERRFDKLVRDLDIAQRRNARKSLAMTTTGHDLRQRLQTIVLALDMAGRDSAASANWLEQAKEETMQLATGLEQLAIQAEVDGGETSPSLSSFPLDPLLQRIERNWRTIAAHKGLKLVVVPCGAHVCSNSDLLESIIDNLAGNAVKHTRAGTILIDCAAEDGRLLVSVRDTGPGIGECDLARIFDPFWRGGANRSGMGLGLTIVRRAAELLAHEITITSLVGRGSCFSVNVPLAQRAPIEPDPLPAPSRTRARPQRQTASLG